MIDTKTKFLNICDQISTNNKKGVSNNLMKSSTISFFGKNYKLNEIRLIRNANDPTGKARVEISVKSEKTNDTVENKINNFSWTICQCIMLLMKMSTKNVPHRDPDFV